jgi:hypothetical protein
MEYTWVIKNLNKDHRGFANSLYLEISGTDGQYSATASLSIAFGTEEYKVYNSWTEEEIDLYATQHQQTLKNSIDEQIELKKAEANE